MKRLFFIKNDLALKRWQRFQRNRRAVWSCWAFIFFLFISATAELWSNSKPVVLSFGGGIYFPVVKTYHPSVFGQNGFVTDYRQLKSDSRYSWSVWPPIQWDPLESNNSVNDFPSPPSRENLLGTDDRGRDVLSRLIYGFRYSIGFALLVWIFSFATGILVGAIMGFSGGRVDLIGQRIVEVFESMPVLLLLITLVSIFNPSMTLLVFLTTAFSWMMISIYMRAEFLKLRKREFVEAAHALGVQKGTIIFKHILPNALSPILTFSAFTIAANISYLAILDYLGFGLTPPTPSWGELLQQAQKNFTTAWWLAVFSSLALFATLVSLNLIGEGIRDAFDPRK